VTRRVSAARAKSQLAECLRKAEHGEPVIITRHGKAVAALVPVDRVAVDGRKPVRAGGGLAGLAGGWKGSEMLVKALRKTHRTRPRRPIVLD
jgi:prevent-host-death family protein